MTTARKPRRARESARLPEPTENQLFEAMYAFERLKTRYRLVQIGREHFAVQVIPEQFSADNAGALPSYHERRFTDEASARQWREHEIIREAITAGMRAKP